MQQKILAGFSGLAHLSKSQDDVTTLKSLAKLVFIDRRVSVPLNFSHQSKIALTKLAEQGYDITNALPKRSRPVQTDVAHSQSQPTFSQPQPSNNSNALSAQASQKSAAVGEVFIGIQGVNTDRKNLVSKQLKAGGFKAER